MIKTFIKPMIYNKNRPGSAEQIAGGTYKNFDYYVLNLKTHPTAYIDVTNSPLNGCDENIDISCHGGITWCDNFVKYIDKKGWFIGWDYAHCEDYIDYGDATTNIIYNTFPNDKKWTTEEIVEECKNVINQIVEKYHE